MLTMSGFRVSSAIGVLVATLQFPAYGADKQVGVVYSGMVVNVLDGDTLDITTSSQTRRIRIAAIDAPEKKQPYGEESKRYLSKLCLYKQSTVAVTSTDKYGRWVAVASCNGQDAALNMVESGHAWVYRRYVTKDDYGRGLLAAERAAKDLKLGLWAYEDAEMPSDYRKRTK